MNTKQISISLHYKVRNKMEKEKNEKEKPSPNEDFLKIAGYLIEKQGGERFILSIVKKSANNLDTNEKKIHRYRLKKKLIQALETYRTSGHGKTDDDNL